VEEGERNVVGGFQNTIQSLFELASFLLVSIGCRQGYAGSAGLRKHADVDCGHNSGPWIVCMPCRRFPLVDLLYALLIRVRVKIANDHNGVPLDTLLGPCIGRLDPSFFLMMMLLRTM
jgi:hypothetical protein